MAPSWERIVQVSYFKDKGMWKKWPFVHNSESVLHNLWGDFYSTRQ